MTKTMRNPQADRDWLAAQPPLPSAAELAAPFLTGIAELFYAFDGRADSMLFHVEKGDCVDQAVELVATAERVASLIRGAIQGATAGEYRSPLLNVDDVVRAITQTPDIERVLNAPHVYG